MQACPLVSIGRLMKEGRVIEELEVRMRLGLGSWVQGINVTVGIEGEQREGQDQHVDQREKLTSRNGGSFKAQKLFHNRGISHVGPGINGSDSSTRPLGHAQHSMPKLGKAQGIFNTGSHVRDGVIDIHSTYELIQKLQAQNHEYEGGHPLTQKSVQKHSRSQSRSKFIGF